MKAKRLPVILMGMLFALIGIKLLMLGVITLERKFEVYPVVSRESISTIDEMRASFGDFDVACRAHQAAERDVFLAVEKDPYYSDQESLNEAEVVNHRVRLATQALYVAVNRRKAVAAWTNWGLLKTITLGTQHYTHSTWLCAPAYATFTTQVNVGFSKTYDHSAGHVAKQ